MHSLENRFIVLGVTGGIAAYKAIEVCRRLVDAGAHVAPVLTESAQRFVGAATFSALASEATQTSLWDAPHNIPHTRLGQSADLILVCPATARAIAAYTVGLSDDLLTATLLASRAPVVMAPAMHTEMWEQSSVQENLAVLAGRGVTIVAPEEGRLAGGDVGAGRLAAPETVVNAVMERLDGAGPPAAPAGAGSVGPSSDDLRGVRVLVTAGGTREPIDPVRFITNRSSGKQGHRLIDEAAARGAAVIAVTTTDIAVPAGVERVRVDTAAEMADAVLSRKDDVDVFVMTAAVADFRPAAVAADKIKKDGGTPELLLEPTVDILATVGTSKRADQTVVGFAAETTNVIANATAKLQRKGADLLVANDLTGEGAGFAHDTNVVAILDASGGVEELPLQSKRAVAGAVFDRVLALRNATN
jgi:phosphopantothenoylcysteine decarboxylase/phosphopantothenate--cysteine ligase